MTDDFRGTIVLEPELCTSCMLCVRECPAWCITLHAHTAADDGTGVRRGRAKYVLDDFAIDFGLCMECGICVDVCPTDALAWRATSTRPGVDRGQLNRDLASDDESDGLDQR